MPEALVGIARLAAEGPLLEAKRSVVYHELPSRSYLNRCKSDKVPFAWTLNPYRGCELACVYCYARYTHEFMELRDPYDFENRIFAKAWNPALFREELRRLPMGDGIGLGTATDPYQPAERRFLLTRRMLEVFAAESGHRLYITTKSNLIARDADLLLRASRRNQVQVGITVTTLDEQLARKLEPRAPSPQLRLEAVRALSEAGVAVGVQCMPVLPRINDSERSLQELALAAAAHGASFFHGQALFLKPCSQRVFFPFLEREFPSLLRRYQDRYAGDGFLRGDYPERIAGRIRRARALAGLRRPAAVYDPPQMSLGF